jgi:hypothetical protein
MDERRKADNRIFTTGAGRDEVVGEAWPLSGVLVVVAVPRGI